MKEWLRKLLTGGKTDQVVEKLIEISSNLDDDRLKDDIAALAAQYNRYRREKALMSEIEQNRRIANIDQALLEIIRSLPEKARLSSRPCRCTPG